MVFKRGGGSQKGEEEEEGEQAEGAETVQAGSWKRTGEDGWTELALRRTDPRHSQL